MRNRKQIIIIGCIVLILLFTVTFIISMGNRKKQEEDLSVENGNTNVTKEESSNEEALDTNSQDVPEPTKEINNDKQGVGQNDGDKTTEDGSGNQGDDKKNEEQAVETGLSKEEVLALLCSTQWNEVGKYTYLAVTFSSDGTMNLWDTVGNPCMKGKFSIDTESMQITLDCSDDVDFDPPFDLPKISTCSFYFTKAGYFCIEYQKDRLLFKKDRNVKADTDMKGYIWNASSASDGSDVSGLKLDLGDYFALYDTDTIYFTSDLYSIGTVDGFITVNWSSYGNDNGEYDFTYSILPYVELGFWDLSDKTLSIQDATDTFEEDMKLQFAYSYQKDTLELTYKGVTITFTRGEASGEKDEAIHQAVISK